MSKFIGTKDFYQETIRIALPIMLQQFVTSFVNLIDNVMIGSVGATALTSVSVANQFYMIFNSMLFGCCGAACIFIAQFYGAGDHKRCQRVLNINLLMSLAAAFLFTLIGFIGPSFVLGLFTKTPSILNLGVDYLDIIKYSFFPNAISFTIMMALRAVAINKVQIKIGLIAVATNTFLNYCLIFGHFGLPMMGVRGAAIATLIARCVECVAYCLILYRQKYFFKFDFKGMIHIDRELVSKMLIKALPLTLNEIFFSLGIAMLFKSYIRVDEHLVAAVTVVNTVINIAFIIFGGLSNAVSIMVGKRLGANELDEAKDNATKLIVFGCFVSLFISTILFVVAKYIPYAYHLSSDINETITLLLRIKSFLLPVYVVNVCAFYILRAGGDARSTLILDSGMLWFVNVTVSTFVSLTMDIPLPTFYLLVESLDIVKMMVAFYYLKKGTWIKNLTD